MRAARSQPALAALACFALLFAACASKEKKPRMEPPAPGDEFDSDDEAMPTELDGGNTDMTVQVPRDVRDPSQTDLTPVLDLPLLARPPAGPKSSATILVRVVDTSGTGIWGAGVSASGRVFETNAQGYAQITDVYGEGLAELYAQGSATTLGHARVPIEADRESLAVVMLHPTVWSSLEDPSAPASFEAPEPPPPPLEDAGLSDAGSEPIEPPPALRISVPGNAFESPWGRPTNGQIRFQSALLSAPESAGAIPGAMLAVIGDEPARVPLDGLVAFELRALQGLTPLALREGSTVTVSFDWPAHGLPAAFADAPKLYRFAEERAAFVESGTLEDLGSTGRATIDALGHFVVGVPRAVNACLDVSLQDGAAAIAHSSVLAVSERLLTATRAVTDATGHVCVELPSGDARVLAISRGASGIARGRVELVVPDAVSTCGGGACTSAPIEITPEAFACVRLRLETQHARAIPIYASTPETGELFVASVQSGQEQCLSLEGGAMLRFGDFALDCGPPVTVPANQAVCSEQVDQPDDCLDLGTIECCLSNEWCDGTLDDDCDGAIDEGCACGGTMCPSDAQDRCCADSLCGSRSLEDPSSCVPLGGVLPSPMCADAMVPVSGELVSVPGCCITSVGQCGALHATFGCVSMSDSIVAWGPGAIINPTPCTE